MEVIGQSLYKLYKHLCSNSLYLVMNQRLTANSHDLEYKRNAAASINHIFIKGITCTAYVTCNIHTRI